MKKKIGDDTIMLRLEHAPGDLLKYAMRNTRPLQSGEPGRRNPFDAIPEISKYSPPPSFGKASYAWASVDKLSVVTRARRRQFGIRFELFHLSTGAPEIVAAAQFEWLRSAFLYDTMGVSSEPSVTSDIEIQFRLIDQFADFARTLPMEFSTFIAVLRSHRRGYRSSAPQMTDGRLNEQFRIEAARYLSLIERIPFLNDHPECEP